MEIATVRNRGQLTIPRSICKAAGIENGDVIAINLAEDGSILLQPKKLVDASQAWFWDEQWQAGMREAEQDINAGHVRAYASDEEFLASFDED